MVLLLILLLFLIQMQIFLFGVQYLCQVDASVSGFAAGDTNTLKAKSQVS